MKIIFEKEVIPEKIIVSPRPVWKCMACPNYRRNPACPPHVPSWKETSEWIKYFNRAVMIKFHVDMDNFEKEKREVLKWLLSKERHFFTKKHPFVFALFPGSCNLCGECRFEENGTCLKSEDLRPSINAIGIEMGSFVNIDFNETVLYGLILID